MVCCAKNASSDARSVRSRESSDDEDARRTATTASESDEETRVVDDRDDDAFARDRDEDVAVSYTHLTLPTTPYV